MDIYGIGAAALGAYRAVLVALRGTGRTQRLLESVKEGDTVIFRTHHEAHSFTRMARELWSKKIYYQVVPTTPEGLNQILCPRGNLHFDHTWVEAYYEDVLQEAATHLTRVTTKLSASSKAPRLTPEGAKLDVSYNSTFPSPSWRD